MKKHLFSLVFLLLSIMALSSCTFATTGDSLEAFSRRMNEINESYNMTSEGYITDTEKCELTKFFRFSESEIMLNFSYDKRNRLTKMNIVLEPQTTESSADSLSFIYDCINAFIQSEEIEAKLLNEIDFENSIKKVDIKTKNAEADNTRMEIDTTELGTIITVYKDLV